MSRLQNSHVRPKPESRRRRAPGPILLAAAIGAVAAIGGTSSAQPVEAAAQAPRTSRTELPGIEASRAPYQAYLAADCITGSNFCKFIAEPVPARRRLEIRRVACQGWHASEMPPNFVVFSELHAGPGPITFVGRIDMLETSYTRVGTNTVWYISEEALTFIPAGHHMQIRLNSASTGVGSYGCTISGYMVRLK
jgi:hypothetical protein